MNEPVQRPRFHLLGLIIRVISTFAILGFAAWGAMALFYQAPGPAPVKILIAALWVALSLVALYAYVRWHSRVAALIYPLLIAALLFWWNAIPASNTRDWADEVAISPQASSMALRLPLPMSAISDWRTSTDYTVRWENPQLRSRQARLDRSAAILLVKPGDCPYAGHLRFRRWPVCHLLGGNP
ncbi:hypothetical protein LP421_26880 [Rhizobium sp. RCAM05350]|nr:hypothetical protein LP421_26880 [Rhizobium sp. RCAM05350]